MRTAYIINAPFHSILIFHSSMSWTDTFFASHPNMNIAIFTDNSAGTCINESLMSIIIGDSNNLFHIEDKINSVAAGPIPISETIPQKEGDVKQEKSFCIER